MKSLATLLLGAAASVLLTAGGMASAANFELRVAAPASVAFSAERVLRSAGGTETATFEGRGPQTYRFDAEAARISLRTLGAGNVSVELYRDGKLVARGAASGTGGQVTVSAGSGLPAQGRGWGGGSSGGWGGYGGGGSGSGYGGSGYGGSGYGGGGGTSRN